MYLPWLGLTNRRNAPGTDSTWWTRTGVPREVFVVVEVKDVDFFCTRDGSGMIGVEGDDTVDG